MEAGGMASMTRKPGDKQSVLLYNEIVPGN
jgi:hypothetical protein